ncbi:probable tRNA pseudouridine synthase 1 isoform X3 [Sturnira hondurensis]|uniref:probable tRNA pseudouridine synthase 1 isoform X3 n=1 Tax=Sturnira hondurensis TaxID=192404 RepID=UPI0018792AFF|nr:probable tRNA pseudouridine synthase 1 isoform X3 [Sturnira hondurensis]
MAAAEAAAVVSSSLVADAALVPETAETAAATAATSPATARTGSEAMVSKAALANKLLSLSGVFAVHKPKGPTSAELLNRLKEKLLAEAGMPSSEWTKRKKQTLKIGHGGTLDSAARGVLEVCRHRRAGESHRHAGLDGESDGREALRYSALKKDGQRLSTLMKRGEAVEAKPARPVTVYSLSLQRFQPPFFTLDVECGGGFYIRSLVSDIGKELSSCANVLELTRTKQGPFTLEEHALPEDRWTIDDIAQSLAHCSSLLPAESAPKKSKPEEPNEHILSCEYITLNEKKGDDDAIKTC